MLGCDLPMCHHQVAFSTPHPHPTPPLLQTTQCRSTMTDSHYKNTYRHLSPFFVMGQEKKHGKMILVRKHSICQKHEKMTKNEKYIFFI